MRLLVRSSILILPFVFAVCTQAAGNPIPQIDGPLAPSNAAPGRPAFTLTVNGTGFVSGSVIDWNGSARPTTFVSAGRITAAISASDVATQGTATITVVNPSPGGGASNPAYFQITLPANPVALSAYVLSQAGTFPSSTFPPTNLSPSFVAVADFNHDGKLDIACINGVLLGNGDGTFQAPISFPPGTVGTVASNSAFFVADVNNDGNPDLVFPSGVLLGVGDGSFRAPISLPANQIPELVGDFDGDGKLDLVSLQFFNGATLSILAGNGDGSFGAPLFSSALPTQGAVVLAAGDFNGDGKLDLMVSEPGGQNVGPLAVYLGNGDGSLQAPLVDSETFAGGLAIATEDLNGDGKLDYLTWSFLPPDPGSVDIKLGNGDGTFQSFLGSTPPAGLAAFVDLNGDGKLDLFGRPPEPGAGVIPPGIGIMLGDGNGSFQPEVFAAANAGVPLFVAAGGDFNGDGKMDLMALDAQGRLWALIQGAFPADTPSPTALDFGIQSIAQPSAPQAVTLTNTGSATLTFSGINISGTDAAMFSQANTCGSTLAAGATCQINVVFTPTSGGARSAILNVIDDGIGKTANAPQVISLAGTGQDFSMSASGSASATVTAGQTATFAISLAPMNGFNQSISLSCSGAPSMSTCSVSPNSVSLSGTSAAQVTVTVTTTAHGSVLPFGLGEPSRMKNWPARFVVVPLGTLVLLFVILLLWWPEHRLRWAPLSALAFVVCLGLTLISCGGGSSGGTGGNSTGTAAGTYMLTVSGSFTSGSATVTHITKLTLVVQ